MLIVLAPASPKKRNRIVVFVDKTDKFFRCVRFVGKTMLTKFASDDYYGMQIMVQITGNEQ